MSTIEEILTAVKHLPPDEQAEFKRRLGAELVIHRPNPDNKPVGEGRQAAIDLDQRVQRALYEDGLLREIKPPITDPTPYRREPIEIKGKPLSETVIEERR
jgi:hypothetical protein